MEKNQGDSMKRILNYPGSKWKMADFIIDIMPEHQTYVEPFFGSGAIYFNKPTSKIETINDVNSRVYNFFKVCRDQPQELAAAVFLTPHSRQEQKQSREVIQDPLEDARNFLIQSWQSIGGIQRHKTGWRSNIDKLGGKLFEWNDIPLRVLDVAGRLKQTQIENQDAIQLLNRYSRPEVLAYVDPPYLLSTRKGRFYESEYTDADHEALLDCLIDFKGYVMLSGYESDMYNEYLTDWHKVYFATNAEAGQSRQEVLWCNFEPVGQIELLG